MVAGGEAEGQLVDAEAGVLAAAEALDIDVETVVAQGLEQDVGTDIGHVQVPGVQQSGGLWSVELVVCHCAATHDKGIDSQVERRLLRSVLRG